MDSQHEFIVLAIFLPSLDVKDKGFGVASST